MAAIFQPKGEGSSAGRTHSSVRTNRKWQDNFPFSAFPGPLPERYWCFMGKFLDKK